MNKFSFAALGAVAISFAVSTASAEEIGTYTPEVIGSTAFGSSSNVVRIPLPEEVRAETVAPVEAVTASIPTEGQPLDMSGADGTLRACYGAGGMAKQLQDFSYICSFEAAKPSATASAYIAPAGVDTGYNGTTNVQDEALMDCMARGGSLIQLASNEQFACAM